MNDRNPYIRELPTLLWNQLEKRIEEFEDAWHTDVPPDLSRYVCGAGSERLALLVELIHTDLEFRLKNGEAARVESYVRQFPELTTRTDVMAALLVAEYRLRKRREPELRIEEMVQRFPKYGKDLVEKLETSEGDRDARADSARDDTTLCPQPVVGREADSLPSVPGYRVLSILGRGGMGIVYKAEHVELKRLVALKMVRIDNDDPEQLARFRAEARAVAQLQHPNIVQVFEVGEHQQRPFIALEFVSGGSLSGNRREALFSERESARLVEAIARAMHFAHQRGIVHRDLKPANILLTDDGQPKVSDFGLAKQRDGGSGQTLTGMVLGTPSYMSPEQASGSLKEVGPLSDVWSLGAILYELLTGRPPFRGTTVHDIVDQVRRQDPAPPSRLQAKTPRDLETICLKCLEKDRQRRYASAEHLAEDLRRFLVGEPIQARPISRRERLVKWVRRRPAVAALVATALLLAFAAAAIGVWAVVSTRRSYQEAIVDRDRAFRERQHARTQKRLADAQTEEARQVAAQSWGLLSEREWEHGRIPTAMALLHQVPADLRGFDWGYRYGRQQGSLFSMLGHTDVVNAVAFSPNGRLLASAGEDQTARLWDVRTGLPGIVLRGHTEGILGVAFSPDSLLLATCSRDRTARLWDVATGELLRRWKEHEDLVAGIAFSPDGRRLATVSWDQHVRLWDAGEGTLLLRFHAHPANVTSVAFSPDGTQLATASWDKTARIWDARSGKLVREFRGHTKRIHSVAFSPDGTRLVTTSDDATTRLWDVRSGVSQHVLRGHNSVVNGAAFNPDGRGLATVADDQSIRVWDSRSGDFQFKLIGHFDRVQAVAFHPGNILLATASADRTVRLWDSRSNATPFALHGQASAVHCVAVSPDGARLATAADDLCARVWDAASGELLATLQGHSARVNSVALSSDGVRAATGADDHTVRFWDIRTGELLRVLRRHASGVTCVAFSPDGTRLASASADRTVQLWDVASGASLFQLKGHVDRVNSLAFRPDGKCLATASHDHTVLLWDVPTGQRLGECRGHTGSVLGVAFSPDGARLATASTDLLARIWDAQQGKLLHILKGHSETVSAATFSPEGACVATCSHDNTVRLWDAHTGAALLELRGHSHPVKSLAFLPDSTRLFSASQDGVVRSWDALARPPVLVLKGHTNRVEAAAFSADGNKLATASSDSSARIWDARTGRLLQTLRGHVAPISCVAFHADGERLATGSEDRSARVWDVRNGQSLFEFDEHTDAVRGVAFSPDGQLLATACRDEIVRIFDLKTGRLRFEMKAHATRLTRVEFAPDGATLISCDANGAVHGWNVRNGELLAAPVASRWADRQASPDGRFLALPEEWECLVFDLSAPDAAEVSYRRQATADAPSWHAAQFARARAEQDWFAAAYHSARLGPHRLLEATSIERIESLWRAGQYERLAEWMLADALVAVRPAAVRLGPTGEWESVHALLNQSAWVIDRFLRDMLIGARLQGHLAADEERWEEACGYFGLASRLPGASWQDMAALALAQLACDDEGAFRETCRQIESAPPPRNTVAVLALARLPSRIPGARVRAVPPAERMHNAQFLHILGASAYRLNRFEEAVAHFEKSAARFGEDRSRFDGFFLSMAYWNLGQADDAREELERATERAQRDPPRNWMERTESRILRREARKLLQAR